MTAQDSDRIRTTKRNAGGRRRGPAPRAILALAMLACIGATVCTGADAKDNVAATVHNLSPTGKGLQKDGRAAGTCAYCHTPHNASPTQALWSRPFAGVTYQMYASTSMQATLNQPTGSSRLCLSCHDGILALSSAQLVAPGRTGQANAAPLTGPTVLGTDLRKSHPFSFTYDTALAGKVGELVDPAGLPATVRLDRNKQLQCTSCHDPHEDTLPKFLRMDNSQGLLCAACHRLTQWSTSAHATSTATWNGSGKNPWPAGGQATLAANGCNACHLPHSAAGERLLASAIESENCTICHSGTVAKKNIAAEFVGSGKLSRHPIEAAQWKHSPNEDPRAMPRHVTCADCHNPHQARAATVTNTGLAGPLQGAAGVSLSGAPVANATQEYQICMKCHGEPATPGATRVDRSRDIRDRLSTSNSSYHPVVAVGRNSTMRGFTQGYTGSSIIGCTDCHNNSDPSPAGPHASRYAPILERNYVATDPSAESPGTYAICYKCHDRNTVLGTPAAPTNAGNAPTPRADPVPGTAATRNRGFPHWVHVVKNQTSCAVCHDAHGSRDNAHLIDFMTRDATGKSVVTANKVGRLDYVPAGVGKGSCYLTCHGVNHNPLSY